MLSLVLLLLPIHLFVPGVVAPKTMLRPSTIISPPTTTLQQIRSHMYRKTMVWTGTRLSKLYGIVKNGNSKVQTGFVLQVSAKKMSPNGKRAVRSQRRTSYGQRKARVGNGTEARLLTSMASLN